MSRTIIIALLLTSAFCSYLFSQSKGVASHEKSVETLSPSVEMQLRKSALMKGNNITTMIYNTGVISRPGVTPNVLDFVWNGLGYAYEIGFLAGAEVKDTNGNTIHIVSDGFDLPSDGDFAPDGITQWGWLPIAGYAKDGQPNVATNIDPASWDPSWAQWPGKFGAGKLIGDVEAFYGMDDLTNYEFEYYPFPGDSTKRGLGLKAEVRLYQIAHPNLGDVFFELVDLKNISMKKLDKVVAGLFSDPHIGGTNNYSDDAAQFDAQRKLAYFWDPDNKSDIPNIAPGYLGVMVLEPQSIGLTSFSNLNYGGNNRPKNDELMWQTLTPGKFSTDLFYPPTVGDGVGIVGSGYFPLDTGATVTFGVALILAGNLDTLVQRCDLVSREYQIRFSKPDPTLAIFLSAPVSGGKYSGNIQITWSSALPDADTTIDLYYSNTYDQRWQKIATSLPNTGSYSWNTAGVPDGIFYKIHLLNRRTGSVAYDSTRWFFTIDNPGDVPPELVLLSPWKNLVASGILPVTWIAGDADEDMVNLKVYISENGGGTYAMLDQVANTGSYSFDTRKYANSYLARIKLEALANGKSRTVESPVLTIRNSFPVIRDSSVVHFAGAGTGAVFVSAVDSALLNGHNYRISFNWIDSAAATISYSINDVTSGVANLQKEPLPEIYAGGRYFDGMRMGFRNDQLAIDSEHTGFVNAPSTNIMGTAVNPTIGTARLTPLDVLIVFNKLDTSVLGEYLFPGDTLTNQTLAVKVVTPFRIANMTETTKLTGLVITPRRGNRWSLGDRIVLLTPPPYKKLSTNTMLELHFDPVGGMTPNISGGEAFVVRMKKPFTPSDLFEFTASPSSLGPTVVRRIADVPLSFELEQNYPNPFNPETRISFSIPRTNFATLRIYDVVGREVRTLLEEVVAAGEYELRWDGKNDSGNFVSSGVYFYRLIDGQFGATKKMLLLR